MVGGLLQHLKALRHIRDDQGWIRELLEEAENERLHLMTFIQVAQPTLFERSIILLAQGPAPRNAIDYWGLPATARLRDVVMAVRDDEAGHRDRNHQFADTLAREAQPAAGQAPTAGEQPESRCRF